MLLAWLWSLFPHVDIVPTWRALNNLPVVRKDKA